MADEHGVSAVTMASLAGSLGVTPMALYQHVKGKDHLLSLMMDHILRPIEVPPRSFGPWYERLRRLHTEVVAAMARYPGMGNVRVTPQENTRLLEGYLQILLDAGFDPATAGLAFTGLYHLAIGAQTPYHGAASPAMLPPPGPSFPAIATVAPAVADVDPESWRTHALDVYIEGLRKLHRKIGGSRTQR